MKIINKMMAFVLLGTLVTVQARATSEFWLANIIGENESIMHETAKRYLAGCSQQEDKFDRFKLVTLNAAKDSYAQATRKLALLINPVVSQGSSLYKSVCSQAQSFVQGFKRMLFGNPHYMKYMETNASSGTQGVICSSGTFTQKNK